MYRLCCYDNVSLDEVTQILRTLPVNDKQTYIIDMRVDPKALWRIAHEPQILVLQSVQKADAQDTARRLSQLYQHYNPLCIILSADMNVIKALFHFDNLKNIFSCREDITADITAFKRDMLVMTDESYEF